MSFFIALPSILSALPSFSITTTKNMYVLSEVDELIFKCTYTLQTVTSSKPAIETVEKGMKCVQI